MVRGDGSEPTRSLQGYLQLLNGADMFLNKFDTVFFKHLDTVLVSPRGDIMYMG